jgi:hypothetical protein
VWIPGQWRKVEGFPLPLYCAGCKSAKWNVDGAKVTPRKFEENPLPIIEQSPANDVPIEKEVKPIVERTVSKQKPKRKVEEKPAGKVTKCKHGFSVLADGTTLCFHCKR